MKVREAAAPFCLQSGTSVITLVILFLEAAINQEEISAVYSGQKLPAYSTLGQLVDTGNKLVFEQGKSQQLIEQYLAETAGK